MMYACPIPIPCLYGIGFVVCSNYYDHMAELSKSNKLIAIRHGEVRYIYIPVVLGYWV